MTTAPHTSEVHHMVDRLAPPQVEALYVILHGMLARTGPTAAEPGPPQGTTARHRFSFVGAMDGEPDLAARSAGILREELGNPTR
jgi:hypothetical protein